MVLRGQDRLGWEFEVGCFCQLWKLTCCIHSILSCTLGAEHGGSTRDLEMKARIPSLSMLPINETTWNM